MRKTSKTGNALFGSVLFILATLLISPPFIQAKKLPDFTVGQIKMESYPHHPGKCYITKLVIKNIGQGAYSNSQMDIGTTLEYGANGQLKRFGLGYINKGHNGTLDRPGGKVVIDTPFPVAELHAGENTFTVRIDPYNHLPESNENNNEKTLHLTCNALPDLAITRVYKKPAPGGGCDVWAEVKNVGQYNLPEEMLKYSQIRFYVGNKDNGYSLSYLTGSQKLIYPGGAIQVIAPGTLSRIKGIAKVKVKLFVSPTSDRAVWDANPNNNEKTVTFYCIPGTKKKPIKPPVHHIPKLPSPNK